VGFSDGHSGSYTLTGINGRITVSHSAQNRFLVEPQLVTGSTVASLRRD
jgi:hypothetical protein